MLPPRVAVGRTYSILLAFWIAATAYNLFKPYHIDDSAHLQFAQALITHPLHPMTTVLNLGGTPEPIWHFNQPPLYFYMLGVWGSLFGYSEPAMHMMGALFSLAAIVLFFRIARVLVPWCALWVTGIMTLGPAFVVEQNLMVDVPLLAVWLLFFDVLIVGTDRDESTQQRRFLVAAGAASAALLIKYSSLVLPPILIAVLLVEKRWRLLWIGAIPFAVLGAWSLSNFLEYRHIHILQRPAHAFRDRPSLPLLRFVGIVVTLGGLTAFPLIVMIRGIPSLCRQARLTYLVLATAGIILVLLAARGTADGPIALLLRILFLFNGALFIATVAVAFVRRLMEPEPTLVTNPANVRSMILLLWVGGHLAFYSLFAPFMAARHVLLVLPALLVVGARLLPRPLPRIDAAFGLATTLALTAMIGWADWRFAAFFRDEASTIAADLPARSRVWFYGGWGWQWYALQAGFRIVDIEDSQMKPGDYLVAPSDEATPRSFIIDQLSSRTPITLIHADTKRLGWGDLFCTARPSHFYGVPYAWLPEGPWTLTMNCFNEVDVYQVG